MADAFGDDLFSVFEEESSKKDKTGSGGTGGGGTIGKAFAGGAQGANAVSSVKNKREVETDNPDDAFFGKKPKLEAVSTEEIK